MQNFPKINIFLIVKLHVQEKEPFFFLYFTNYNFLAAIY